MIENLQTYSPSDTIPYSAEVLNSLIKQYNLDIWPLQIPFVLLSLLLLFGVWRRPDRISKPMAVFLGLCWIFLAAIFYLRHYQSINWSAPYFAYFFLTQGALLLVCGLFTAKVSVSKDRSLRYYLGLGIFALSVFVPIGVFFGREFSQLASFGWGVENTVLGSVSLLQLVDDKMTRNILSLIPLLSILVFATIYFGLYT